MGKKRILFIDDRPEHLRQPVLRLQVAGYAVEEASTGEAGLERLREESFDVLILDSELPHEDGWDVLKQVRASPDIAGLKVSVLLAGKGRPSRTKPVPVTHE